MSSPGHRPDAAVRPRVRTESSSQAKARAWPTAPNVSECSRPYGHMVEGELRIEMFPSVPQVEYWGTSAQLEAEGLIPASFEWPYSDQHARWSLGGFEYQLFRVPPRDVTCLRSEWVAMDNWRLRQRPIGASLLQLRREAQSDVLPAPGVVRMEWCHAGFHLAASRDRRFRRFLDRLLPPPKRRTRQADGSGRGGRS